MIFMRRSEPAMPIDPFVQRAYDAALAILEEAGHVNGVVLLCELDGGGLMIAVDDERLPVGPLAGTLRMAADQIDGMEP
jgi:hypothetical protein